MSKKRQMTPSQKAAARWDEDERPASGSSKRAKGAQPTPSDNASPFSLQNVVIPLILMGAATAFGFLMLGRQGLL
ncbi:hypothetical protein [Adlercreutzia sp. ZJ473]|uniref:hypothetical protein n=1 Tax=Adlercreutzia sp. ZJ473 TaxID=2722822 RepID=UPI001554C1A9|nr:hypothetical protein [Adlercreutzia sp. ZJ473]